MRLAMKFGMDMLIHRLCERVQRWDRALRRFCVRPWCLGRPRWPELEYSLVLGFSSEAWLLRLRFGGIPMWPGVGGHSVDCLTCGARAS